ncbi:MAG TPA: hypothetical protein PLK46_05835 [Propioniciclava sp.]|uniref:AbiTii domain-containing protein n=1 Tax=Propioniciclava sp. TaxID=2038686 RepID=UPI002B8B06E1|nr:hypothetical protein [Propioniciclava sp.]HRL47966.1 hypothetical protein [Propioniciclava sp.]HRL79835.1 hypothetical protein [Propioniciclava sp.]
MPNALENAVDALSDPNVALPDALRRLLVVARRIGADALADWIGHELNGYQAGDPLPSYRSATNVPVALRFAGPFQSNVTRTFSVLELPDELRSTMDSVAIREPVASCVALAAGDQDPELPFPIFWVLRYRELAELNQAPGFQMMQLDHAAARFPRTHLLGVLDRIRTTGLDLALSFEDVSPNVGSLGGPTIDTDTELARVVNIGVINVFGERANVAVGEGAQALQVNPGDVPALLEAAAHILEPEGVEALKAALDQDAQAAGPATRGFLLKVKEGAVGLVAGIGVNGAYDGLLHLLQSAFPGFSG